MTSDDGTPGKKPTASSMGRSPQVTLILRLDYAVIDPDVVRRVDRVYRRDGNWLWFSARPNLRRHLTVAWPAPSKKPRRHSNGATPR